ncbi:MAG: class I SAM-dependent methyltransferase [Candidatus Rokubacteria bacterium]|nr:class I SAM-dependent methyltransferase [Candidatus Rokubacteria bacterium]
MGQVLRTAWRLGLRATYPLWLIYLEVDGLLSHRLSIAHMKHDWNDRARRDARLFVALDAGQTDDQYRKSGEQQVADLIESRLDVLLPGIDPQDADVLELGCGTGRMTRPMSGLFRRVTALDISAEMVTRARESLRDHGNVSFVVGSGIDLTGLPDHAFDLVVSFLVFQHIPDKAIVRSYFKESARVLRSQSTFFFQVRMPLEQERHLLRRPKGTWIGALYRPDEVVADLSQAGLDVVESWGHGTSSLFVIARKGK